MRGATFDLSAAYRQMSVASSSLWASHVACVEPGSGHVLVFRLLALPFGASRAVYAFLRLSHALWHIAHSCLWIPITSFFDDFISFSDEPASCHTKHSIEALFKLLGWDYAESGEKAGSFAANFAALGITIDLSRFDKGLVRFSNTEKRISELSSFLQDVCDCGRLNRAIALKLRGRMQFASCQIFGRSGQDCLREVTKHAYESKSDLLAGAVVKALLRFKEALMRKAPRLVHNLSSRPG